jgi:hypothetical protein
MRLQINGCGAPLKMDNKVDTAVILLWALTRCFAHRLIHLVLCANIVLLLISFQDKREEIFCQLLLSFIPVFALSGWSNGDVRPTFHTFCYFMKAVGFLYDFRFPLRSMNHGISGASKNVWQIFRQCYNHHKTTSHSVISKIFKILLSDFLTYLTPLGRNSCLQNSSVEKCCLWDWCEIKAIRNRKEFFSRHTPVWHDSCTSTLRGRFNNKNRIRPYFR